MSNLPDVSIVVPAFQAQDSLRRCLESLQRQKLKELEVIIVDDGSSDGTAQIAREFELADKRFKTIRLQANRGVHFARHAGVQASSGRYLGFVDSDDWVAEEMYAQLLSGCETHFAQISMCGMLHANTETKEFAPRRAYPADEVVSGDLLQMFCSWKFRTGSICNRLYLRELIEENPAWKTQQTVRINEDYLLNLKAFELASRAVCLKESYYFASQVIGSATRSRSSIQLLVETLNAYDEALSLFSSESRKVQVDMFFGAVIATYQHLINRDCERIERKTIPNEQLTQLQLAVEKLKRTRPSIPFESVEKIFLRDSNSFSSLLGTVKWFASRWLKAL